MKTIIFDFDGTLADTIPDITDSVNYAMKIMDKPTRTCEEVTKFVSEGLTHLLSCAICDAQDEDAVCRAKELFLGYYRKHCCDKTKPYNGVFEVLDYLQKRGDRICVLSNKKDDTLKIICKKLFPDRFRFILGETDHIAKKPSREMFDFLCSESGAKPEQCVYIGDSEIDLRFSLNCGIRCISAGWGYRSPDFLRNCGARFVAHNPKEIIPLL